MKKIILISALTFFSNAFAQSSEFSQYFIDCNYKIKELVPNVNEESINNVKQLYIIKAMDPSVEIIPKYCNSYKDEKETIVFGYYNITSKIAPSFKSAGFIYYIDQHGNLKNEEPINETPNVKLLNAEESNFLDKVMIGYLGFLIGKVIYWQPSID